MVDNKTTQTSIQLVDMVGHIKIITLLQTAPNKILSVSTEVTTTNAIGTMAHSKINLPMVFMLVQIRLLLEVGKTKWTGLLIITAGMDPHGVCVCVGGGGGGGHNPTALDRPAAGIPIRSMEDGYFVAGYTHGKSLAFLVDTGSCCTILSKNVFDRWPQETRPCLSPVNMHLITATGEMSPFLDKAEIEITLGSQKVLHDVLFADVKNDGILGMDFLTKHRCDMFLSKNHLILNGGNIACFHNSVDAISTCCRIAILESVEVLPESEIIVRGRPMDMIDKNSTGVVEATDRFVDRNGLLNCKSLSLPRIWYCSTAHHEFEQRVFHAT